ncbi:hypothetical protein JCM11491_006442 [Sporobolomyces phaffii]
MLTSRLARFHRLQRSALVSKCANLSLREDDQGIQVSSVAPFCPQPPRLATIDNSFGGCPNWLALVKSTLRTFLGQITTAFEAFVGLAASSSAHSALAPPTHPFLSITVSDNIEPIDLEELKRSLEAEHALEERELGGILQEMHSLVQAVAVAIVSAKHRSDSIRHRELTDSEQSHCAHELKNERLRQSILAFIASIRGAQQTLIAEDGGSAE